MIEHYAKNHQFKPAYALLDDMRNKIPNVNVACKWSVIPVPSCSNSLSSDYINMQTIRAIEQALNTKILSNNLQHDQDEDDDGIIDETDRYNWALINIGNIFLPVTFMF